MNDIDYSYCHIDEYADDDDDHCCLDYMECEEYPYYYENIDDWITEYNNGWILCSERMPEVGERVLIQLTTGCVVTARLVDIEYKKYQWFVNLGTITKVDTGIVIAWQPLPEPYNLEED